MALSEAGKPYWWGECGSVTSEKLSDLHASFPSMRLTIAKWGHSDLSGYAAQLRQAMELRLEVAGEASATAGPRYCKRVWTASTGSRLTMHV